MSSRRPPRPDRHAALLDASAFYALTDPQDANNSAAKRIAQQFYAERWQLVTTNFIRAEVHALLLKGIGRCATTSSMSE